MLNGLIMGFSWGLVLFFDTSSNVLELDTRHTAGVDQSQDTDDHQENHSPRELIIIMIIFSLQFD